MIFTCVKNDNIRMVESRMGKSIKMVRGVSDEGEIRGIYRWEKMSRLNVELNERGINKVVGNTRFDRLLNEVI